MAGIMDSPFLGLFNKYFRRKRSIANGVAFAGSSLGCLVLPLMLRWSIDAYTIRGAMFLMGGVWMHACVVAAVMCPLPAQDRTTMSREVSRETHALSANEIPPEGAPILKRASPKTLLTWTYVKVFPHQTLGRNVIPKTPCR